MKSRRPQDFSIRCFYDPSRCSIINEESMMLYKYTKSVETTRTDSYASQTFPLEEMKICGHVPSIFLCITTMFLFFLYFILFLSPTVFSAVQLSHRRHPPLGNASDQEALLGFKSAITYNPSQSMFTTWKQNVSFCQWTGVICSRRRQRVVSLNVSSMGLEGTISPHLGNLSFLKLLDLHNNSFHGQIPFQLGNLFRLRKLDLDMNHLHGSIPPTLCGCRSLLIVYMDYNNLTGTIPTCLGNISSLYDISAYYNELHGSVPSELGMLSHVRHIGLQFNHLTGQIPPSLSNCTNLQRLDINGNHLTGHIPTELCSKNTQMLGLYLFSNQLSGSIPSSLFNCTNLQILELGTNHLSGVVPMELGKLMQLQQLRLGSNKLVSSSTTPLHILTVLTNCSNLIVISLVNNHLKGRLRLVNNHLKGRLPFSIGHLSTKMRYMNLGLNELGGEILPQIGNLTNLTLLGLNNNFFTGVLPYSLNMLEKLEWLLLGGNRLQGNIPMEIGQLKSLGLLAIEENNLSGRIPDSFAHLQQLRYLYLYGNQLSGKIPTNLCKCPNLLLLDLSYNRRTGDIPREVGGLANLAIYFNISNNLLEGPVSLELSKMTMVQAIDISANQLSGHIPSGLGSCKELEYLNLSCNALEGPIPMSLGELLSLQDVDFSSNNLSGGIPMSLVNLKMLNQLNFSFNNLSGEVPKGGVFKTLGATVFMGNPGLCGPWVSLPPCSTHKHKSVLHLKRVIIPIVAVAVIVVSCLFLGIVWRWNYKSHISIEVGASLNLGHQRISYGELITATEEFSDANLLGVGSFGKVYKGVLNNGTIVAVKLLNLENEGAQKSFDRECQVLGRVRHRNLIRIITSYSDHEIKALIFPLMPNGSLDKWLYPEGEVERGLTLIQRLNIAIDIAHGMAYLHHHCFMQVIHCDMKPNNVLLGEDMTAYLIDFGIASICYANSDNWALTSTHALKGSTGYIPPEYGLGGRVTTKGDVYSYGVVLLEMLTRKKPTDDMFVEGMNLQKWVARSFPNQVVEVVDKSLLKMTNTIVEEDKKLNCLSHLVSVGLLCTKESPEERPTVMNIVSTLQNIRENFLEAAGIPKFQSDITHLLGSTSTACNNTSNTDQGQSSSTF